jgi:cell wall assembly regulator SMI1
LDDQWEPPQPEAGSKLKELKHALGFRIPDDVLEGIGLYAGVSEAWSEPDVGEHVDPGAELDVSGESLFDYGAVSFLSVEGIVSEYEERRKLTVQMEPPEFVLGPVRARYFDKHWIPVAADVGAGRFALDLSPAKGGAKGQVIWIQDEASIVRVVASSVEEFLEYGCECLRYELSEVNTVPRPPFRPVKPNPALDGELMRDPECARIAALWGRIVQRAKAVPATSELGSEFRKPGSMGHVEKLQRRMKTVFPKQLVCSLRVMGQADGMWLQPGKLESRPIAIGLAPEVPAWDKLFRKRMNDGEINVDGLAELKEPFQLVLFASAGGFKESLYFFVVCSSDPHPLAGNVLLLHSCPQEKDTLTLFSKDIASFLEQGLSLMNNDLHASSKQTVGGPALK